MMVSAHDVVDFSAASLTDQGLPEHSGSHKLGLVDQILASHRTSNRHPAPIHKLPAEILAHIFTYVCTRLRASAESMPDYAMLVSITHICRLWRAVALGSATLWSHISLNHKSALAFAKRSQAALLTVTVSVRGKKWQKKMGLLRRLLPRIRKLHVKVTRAEDMLKLADTLSSQHITSFTLQLSTKWVNGQPVSLPPLGTIPPMFEGLSPSLRSLTIVTEDHWRIPFGHFPGLTNLRLIHDGLSIDSMSFNHLLSFLSNTPNLEDLEVRTLTPFSQSYERPSPTSELVRLMRLRQLTLVMGDVFALYSELSMPEDAMVTLVGIPSNLPIRDPHLQLGAFTAVELIYRGWEVMLLARNAYRRLELGNLVGPAPSTQRNSSVVYYARYLSAVETLSLTVSRRTSHRRIWLHLLALLAHAPLLKALYIRDINSRVIPGLVQVLTDTQTDPDSAPALCPQLRTLTISLVSPSGHVAQLAPLFRATEARARRGIPLQSLTICSPRHRTLNPANVLSHGAHGLEWLLLCDRDLYLPHDSDTHGDGDEPPRAARAGTAPGLSSFREKAVRSFRRRWEARESEGTDSAQDDEA